MVDDAGSAAAQRMRRVRRCRKGEHDLCSRENCEVVRSAALEAHAARMAAIPVAPAGATPLPDAGASGRVPGPIETMARAYVDGLPFGPADPRRMIGELAVALGRKVDEDGAAPPAVRELRTMLMQITELPNQAPGVVDELRLQRAHRRFDAILANVEKGMSVALDPAV